MNKQLKTLDDLRRMTSVTISNALAAEVLRMDPARLAGYARQGMLGWNTTQSGNRILHSREGLIRYWSGETDEQEPEEPTERQIMMAITDSLKALLEAQKTMLQLMDEQNDLIHAMMPGPALRYANKDRR